MSSNPSKKWNAALRFQSPLYIFPVCIMSCTYAFASSGDNLTVNGDVRSVDNLILRNDTHGDFIIRATNNAVLTTTGLELISSGKLGGGAWINNSTFSAEHLRINVTGSNAVGVYLADDSSAKLHDVSITAQSNAIGLLLDGEWSTTASIATAQVTDSTISTDAGDAVRVNSGALTLDNLSASTLGNHSYAINANAKAQVKVEGGKYLTQGNYSDAIWVASKDSSATVNNASIVTKGDRSSTINAQNGSAVVTHSILETQGENSYGLYTHNQVLGRDLAITTTGTSGAGVFTALGGKGTLIDSTIKTHGELAPGLLVYPGSKITAENVKIETTGNSSFGLWARAGNLHISKSEITTGGEAASGLYVNGYSSTLKNDVTLENVTLKADKAQAIEIDTTELLLTVNDSSLIGGNGNLMTVNNYEDSTDPAKNLYSNVSLNAANSSMKGDIVVMNKGNQVAIALTSGSLLVGAASNVNALSLDKLSRWNMDNNSTVEKLTNNGTVTFSDLSKYDTLTIAGDYAGDGGVLVMNGVLGDDSSPANQLIVGGNVLPGATSIVMNNLGGHGAETIEGIKIIDVAGTSQGSFDKAGRIVAGAYDYNVIKKGESWYLTSQHNSVTPDPTPTPKPDDNLIPGVNPKPNPEPNPEPNPGPNPGQNHDAGVGTVRPEGGSYAANQAAGNTLFTMSLHDRLGETQFVNMLTGQKEVTSLWLRQLGGHNKWFDESGQLKTQSNRYVTQLGGDIARWSTNGADRTHVGVMTGYANQHSTTDNYTNGYRSKGFIEGYSIGGYATWYANDKNRTGAWLDSWLQYNWFNNEVSGDDLTTETYKSHGFTASLESGYSWKAGQFLGSKGTVNEWFIQPQAQVVWMGVRADNHREANGTRIQQEGKGGVMTRVGVKTWLKSHHARDNNKQRDFQPYVTLSWLHNTRSYGTKMDDVSIRQKGATDLAEIKVGLEGQINPRLNTWGNVSTQIGGSEYNDTAAMVGIKYNF